jgi:hypothetical protein
VIRPYRALATVAVFAAFLVAGNALGKDERSEPAPAAARTSAVSLGALRLDPAAKLPDLREVRRERQSSRRPARTAVVADAPPVAESPEASGAGETAPASVIESPPTYTPQPQSPPANTVESAPEQPAAPAPDPAPSPAPAPSPDPSPGGGP